MNKEIIYIDENIPLLLESITNSTNAFQFSAKNLENKDLINSNATALVVRSKTKVNEDLLKNTNIKFVGTATSGIDHIDIEYLKKYNIIFRDAKGSNANSVAEYVIYSILKWASILNTELKNITIGIIGYGCIGKIVARYTNYLGLKVLINDPPLQKSGFRFPEFAEYCSLDDICRNSDIITNHVPLTIEGEFTTFNLLKSSNISLIKENSLFIHTSRGGGVDEEALLNELKNKNLYLAIDVWENEPLINEELANKTILATPHIAGYSRDGKLKGSLMMAQALYEELGVEYDLRIIQNELGLHEHKAITDFNDYESIKNALLKHRSYEEDNLAFLDSLKSEPSLRAKKFDELRKNYPVRYEVLR